MEACEVMGQVCRTTGLEGVMCAVDRDRLRPPGQQGSAEVTPWRLVPAPDFWTRRNQPQSVFKHAILDPYLIRLAVMTASKLSPKRAVLADGFPGRGRHDDGSPASSESMMLAAQKAKATRQVDLFLVEKSLADYRKVDEVANEYRGPPGDCADSTCGVRRVHGRGHRWRRGGQPVPDFDPCGANLPWDQVVAALETQLSS